MNKKIERLGIFKMLDTEWIIFAILKFSFLVHLSEAVEFNDKSQKFLNEWCASVPNIEHGIIQRFHFNPSVAQVVCNDGYKLVGNAKLTCNDSEWNPVKLPYCEKIKIDNPPHADAGKNVVIYHTKNVVVLNGSNSYDDHGIISYHWWNEDLRHTIDMRGTRTAYLHVYNLPVGVFTFTLKVVDTSGQQSTDSVQVTVKSAQCSIPDIAHSTFEWMDYGKSGLLICNTGAFIHINYIKYRSLRIKCESGEWMSSNGYKDLPDCIVDPLPETSNECPSPPSISNGYIDHVQNTKYPDLFGFWNEDSIKTKVGSKVTYACNEYSYKLLGNPVIECLKDGTWSRYKPTCIELAKLKDKVEYCQSIPPIPNGHCGCNPDKDISFCDPFYLSMTVECRCNRGYRLVGTKILRCTDSGFWDHDQPTCVGVENVSIDTNSDTNSETGNVIPSRMNTLAVVIATACSVLGILLLIMVIMIVRRRKPRPRHFHQVGVPPPYTRVHSNSIDELDRVALIGYDAARLPTYEEAVRNNSSQSSMQRGQGLSEIPVSNEFRPLPNIPNVIRNNDAQSVHSNRHSITTMSTVNRDGISEVFGSIDTVNYSMSDASTSVTVDTLESTASRPSHGSGTATAGSMTASQENIVTEEAPLIVNDITESEDQGEEMDVKDEDKD